MITTVIICVAGLFGTDVMAWPTWHATYKDAVGEARRVDKPLFILFNDGSSSAVRLVGQTPVLSDAVERVLTSDFVRMYVDTETDSGRTIANEFSVAKLPMILVVDRAMELPTYRSSGTPTTEQLLSVLSQYRGSKYPSSTASTNSQAGVNPSANLGATARTESRAESSPVRSGWSSAWWCRT